ncbi:MAG: response regulator transcription factor [Propioniciclava sp.]|uniref:response regulator n=1 Tax=Propioniciclava sp. TaxID=2038686 RepID=UPI0039E64104
MTIPSSGATRVLVVDDDASMRRVYRALFKDTPEFELVGEARNGFEAFLRFARTRPDLVLMDLQMPLCSGIDATRRICAHWPSARVVALTTFGTRENLVAALRAGAVGYLLKDIAAPSLFAGMRHALLGDMPVSRTVRRLLVDTLLAEPPSHLKSLDPGLAAHEIELLGWLTRGLTNVQIGRKMYLSEASVELYLDRIADRMGTTSRIQILIKAIQMRLVDPYALPAPAQAPLAR